MKIHEQARLLAEQGFRIMPLADKQGPMVEGFGAENPDFTVSPDGFFGDNVSIGLLCGPCPALGEDHLVCFDLDGDFAIDPIVDFLELLPFPTLESHDCRHLFFRVRPGPLRDRLKQWRDALHTKKEHGAALDLRWAGGYACERGDWGPAVDLTRAAAAIQVLPDAALQVLLDANNGGRDATAAAGPVVTDRVVDPKSIPTPEEREHLLTSWAGLYPPPGAGGGRDICFALGGLLARGQWPDEYCEEFLDDLLERVSDDPAHQADGLECARLSLEKGPGAEGVYGIPKLAELLVAPPDDPEGMPGRLKVGMFLERFVAAMQATPTTVAELETTISHATAVAAGEDIDDLLTTWQARLKRDSKGEPLAVSFNALLTLQTHPEWRGVFAWDELAQKVVVQRAGPRGTGVETAGSFWSPDDGGAILVQGWFALRVKEMTKTVICDAIKAVARQNSYHPVRRYLTSLPEWDGTDRNLCAYFRAEPTEYQRAACAVWLRNAVGRAMRPGCHVKDVLILEGPQNAGKSTALRALCPNPEWFLVVRADVRSKDFMSNLRGKWIAEISEFDRLTTSRDASEVKDILSSPVDTYRKAYGADEQDYPRQGVFAGSTNHSNYLRDETGNVRFRSITCGQKLDLEGIARDRDLIWAQAYLEWAGGEPLWFTEHLERIAAVEAAARLESDPWEDMIAEAINSRTLGNTEQERFTTLEALARLPGAVPGAQVEQKHMRRMAKVLRKLGYDLKKTCRQNVDVKLWLKV